MKNEPVDDVKVIERIIKDAVVAIKKLLQSLNIKDEVQTNLVSFCGLKTIVVVIFCKFQQPLSTDFFDTLPNLVSAKFSPYSQAVNARLPHDINYYGYSFNPDLWIPPVQRNKYEIVAIDRFFLLFCLFVVQAIVAQGQHIFTFDGKHLTFPGKCKYVLAHDGVNENFTITGTYINGLLTDITLIEKHNQLSINSDGKTFHNGGRCSFHLPKHLFLFSKKILNVACFYLNM